MNSKVFKKYQNSFLGQSCNVFGTGPSLLKYKQNNTHINIGVNEIIYHDIVMDFYFLADAGNTKRGYRSDPEKYEAYLPKIDKFYRSPDSPCNHAKLPPNSKRVSYYKTDHLLPFVKTPTPTKVKYIETFSVNLHNFIVDGGSIIFDAMQFALYCGFQTINLIGCDCNYTNGSFYAEKSKCQGKDMISGWSVMKKFIDKKYPEVSIITINPVRMDLFNDKV